jgi:hypothetical protein
LAIVFLPDAQLLTSANAFNTHMLSLFGERQAPLARTEESEREVLMLEATMQLSRAGCGAGVATLVS